MASWQLKVGAGCACHQQTPAPAPAPAPAPHTLCTRICPRPAPQFFPDIYARSVAAIQDPYCVFRDYRLQACAGGGWQRVREPVLACSGTCGALHCCVTWTAARAHDMLRCVMCPASPLCTAHDCSSSLPSYSFRVRWPRSPPATPPATLAARQGHAAGPAGMRAGAHQPAMAVPREGGEQAAMPGWAAAGRPTHMGGDWCQRYRPYQSRRALAAAGGGDVIGPPVHGRRGPAGRVCQPSHAHRRPHGAGLRRRRSRRHGASVSLSLDGRVVRASCPDFPEALCQPWRFVHAVAGESALRNLRNEHPPPRGAAARTLAAWRCGKQPLHPHSAQYCRLPPTFMPCSWR